MLNKIEQAVFFPVVRIIGVIVASVSCIAIVVGIIFAFTFNPSLKGNNISFNDVKKYLESDAGSLENLKFPANIKKYFFDEDNEIDWELERMLRNNFEYEDIKGQQKFINDLSDIIGKAEKSDPENVEDYIESFVELRFDRGDDDDALGISQFIKSNVAPVIQPIAKSVVRAFILFGVCLLFILFTVVVMLLLLLSIERNLRSKNNL